MLNQKLKKIFLNFSIRTVGSILSKTLGFITLPFIARAVGPEGFGTYSFIITLITYTAILVEWGYTPYGLRETAKHEDSSSVVNNIINTRFTFGIISMIIGAIAFSIVYWNKLPFLVDVFIGFGFIVSQIINVDYYYFGKKKMLIPTVSQLSGQIVFVIGVLFFIKTASDFRLLMVLYVAYQFIGSIIGLLLYLSNHSIKLKFSIKASIETIKKTFRLGLSARIEQLTSTYPILIIPLFFVGTFELGLYTSAFKFFTIVLIVYQVVMLTIAPYLVNLQTKAIHIQRKTIFQLLSFLFFMGVLSSIFFFVTDKYIVALLFGESFKDAIPVVDLIIFILLPFWPITMVLGGILIYYNFDKYYLQATIVNAVFILMLTPLLVYTFGISGAIYSIGIGNFSVILISIYYLNKLIPNLFINPINYLKKKKYV